MRLRISDEAREDLFNLADYIAIESPANSQVVGERILQAGERLLDMPRMGGVGRVASTREWPVRRTPYILVYRVDRDEVLIIRVLHGHQDWPPA